jgi:hypothetical protein
MPDVTIQVEGSITLLHLNTPTAEDWVDENISDERTTWGDALVVEHRFVAPVLAGMRNDGLEVSWL